MSKYRIDIIPSAQKERWNKNIEISEASTIYHQYEWLKTASIATNSELLLLEGYKGQKLIMQFPLFVKKFYSFKFIFSPPPNTLIPELGPVFFNMPKDNYKKEKFYINIINEFDRFIRNFGYDYIQIKCNTRINDARPFIWNNYIAIPKYTYILSLNQDIDDIFKNFKNQTRTDIKRCERNIELEVIEGDFLEYKKVFNLVRERYDQQHINLGVKDEYIDTIYRNFKDNIECITVYQSDTLLTGFVFLNFRKKVMHWIGGIRPKGNFIGINEMIHWNLIKEKVKKHFEEYDLVGANTERLYRYKAKFKPSLKQYFQFEKASFKGNLVKSFYKMLKKK